MSITANLSAARGVRGWLTHGWAFAIAAVLSACGGGGGGDGGDEIPPVVDVQFEVISGAVACGPAGCSGDSPGGESVGSGGDGGDGAGGGLGAMRFITVTARKPDGTVLGSAELKDNLVSLYPRAYTGPFILEFADDGSGRGAYFDEALRAWVSTGSQKLHALIPSLTHHVSVNPLTEAAYQWAIAQFGQESSLTAARMTEANQKVLDAFNSRLPAEYRITDPTNYAEVVSETTLANALPNTHAGRFGIILAGMATAAQAFDGTLPDPALAFTRQFVADIGDDASFNASVEAAQVVAYDLGVPEALETSVVAAVSDFGSSELPPPSAAPNVCYNAELERVGSTWRLDYQSADSSGTSVTFQFDYSRPSETEEALSYVSPFDGQMVTESRVVGALDASGQALSLVRVVAMIDLGRGGPEPITFEDAYVPPLVDRTFLLKVGESDRGVTTVNATVRDANGLLPPGYSDSSFSADITTTFVGFETVTVPAGTFANACKFETVDASSGIKTFWITSSGQGVQVKSVSDSSGFVVTDELIGGNVNGTPVR